MKPSQNTCIFCTGKSNKYQQLTKFQNKWSCNQVEDWLVKSGIASLFYIFCLKHANFSLERYFSREKWQSLLHLIGQIDKEVPERNCHLNTIWFIFCLNHMSDWSNKYRWILDLDENCIPQNSIYFILFGLGQCKKTAFIPTPIESSLIATTFNRWRCWRNQRSGRVVRECVSVHCT